MCLIVSHDYRDGRVTKFSESARSCLIVSTCAHPNMDAEQVTLSSHFIFINCRSSGPRTSSPIARNRVVIARVSAESMWIALRASRK